MITAHTLALLGLTIMPLALVIAALAAFAFGDDKPQARRLAALAMFIATFACALQVIA